MKYSNMIKAHSILDLIEDDTPAINVEINEDDEDGDDDGNSIINLLQMALLGEYQQWDMYVAYASRLKGLSRSAIADEFKAHADEEQEHIDLIQRYIVSLGANPTLQRKPIPEMPEEATMKEIVQLQLKFEMDAVNLYKKILNVIPDNDPLKIDIENVISKEQEHVHDLELLLKDNPVSANAKKAVTDLLDDYYADRKRNQVKAGMMFRPTEHGEPTKPQAGYGQGCGCSCPTCHCQPTSFLIRVDNAWCTKAMKELTPDIYARWYQGKLLSAQEKEFIVQAIALKWGLRDRRAMCRFLDGRKA